MPRTPTLAARIATLREQFAAAGPRKKRTVASALWSLCLERGPAARAALPWLRELAVSADEQLVGYGTYALGRIGPRGRAELRQLLSHRRAVVRSKAAYGLAQSGDWSPATIRALVRLLKSRTADDRAAALSALETVAEISERTGLLVRYQGLLIGALDDREPEVRSHAPGALLAAFRSPRHFVEYAITRLDQPAGHVRIELLGAFARQLEELDTRRYLPAILGILRAKPDLTPRFLAVLTHAGPDAADLAPLLEPLAADDSLEGLRAGAALLRIDGRADVLERLARRLPESPDEIAGILCDIGAAAAPLAPALARVIDDRFGDPDWDLTWALADALAAIESHADVAVRALCKLLGHERGHVRASALSGLERRGPAARSALLDLKRLQRGADPRERRRVGDAIRAIEKPTN
jgi:HEAT repeat protein